jgi:hypothetical protein
VLVLGALPASAGGLILRGGLGITPDQAVVGVQTHLQRQILRILHMAPSVDAGFGDNVTTVCGNLDFLLAIPPKSDSAIYAGAGATLTWWNFDGDTESDTEIGLSLVGGLRFGTKGKNGYIGEVRFGVGDVPDLRILIGINFGGGSNSNKN